MADLLAEFWTQRFEVRRYLGDGATGPIYADPVQLLGRIKHANRLVINSRGDEVVSSSRISMPVSVDEIPVGSLARAVGDERWRPVEVESRHVGGFAHSPDYYSIDLT